MSATLRAPRSRPALPQAQAGITVTSASMGGLPGSRGLEGASTSSREMASWRPPFGSPDRVINGVKDLVDARGRDQAMNNGGASNAVQIHRNSIVGTRYVLNARPNWRVLGANDSWAEEFTKVVEDRFSLTAESPKHWFDAARKLTFTGLIRLGVGGFVFTGELLSSAEWIKDEPDRPCKTAVQMIAPARLSNPNGVMDSPTLRRGVERDSRGKAIAYHIRQGHPGDLLDPRQYNWLRVPAETKWGRLQMLHVTDPLEPDQTRGIADMVAILKDMRMAQNFKDITLQNAVVNATYAAAIESELPGEVIAAQMGGGNGTWSGAIGDYMDALLAYIGDANNLRMDGVMIPHLFPGTKLALKPAGTPGGVGTDFEASLLRHISAGLGVSYEEFTKDYSKLSYSGGRLSLAGTDRFMAARKRIVADEMANALFSLWLEEELANQNLPPLPGKSARATYDFFYLPLMKEAFCAASWIGASSGQVDPYKETQAAILRMNSGLSTQAAECAALGLDSREVNEQRAREKSEEKRLGLDYVTIPAKATQPTPADEAAASGPGDPNA